MAETNMNILIYRKDYDNWHRVYRHFSDAAEEAIELRNNLAPDEAQDAEIFITYGPVVLDDNEAWALPEDDLGRHFEVARVLPSE